MQPYPDDPAGGEPHVINEDRWASIPEALLCDPDITDGAVRVYGVLRRHGDDPHNCYPSHARIAKMTGKSPRSIPALIRALEEAGWITRVPRKSLSGDPDSNGYIVRGRAAERGVRAGERGGVRAPEQGGSAQESAPKESKVNESQGERQKTSPPPPAVVTDGYFDAFWQRYPRKVGKPTAATAYARAVKRGTEPGRINEMAEVWTAHWREAQTEPQFIPHPTTWLNQARYDDTPVMPVGQRSARDRQVDNLADLVRETYQGPVVPQRALPQ